MNIATFQIASTGNILFQTKANTLDEVTRELPQGFYTTFSTLSNGTRVMGLRAHLQRLYVPAVEQGIIPSVTVDTLRIRIAELAKLNLPKESRIRLMLIKNDGKVYASIQPFEPLSKQVYVNGVKVITAEMARHDPRIKDTGFISSSLAQRVQIGTDVFEVLLTKDGNILEGMTSNFYAIKGNTLITARRGILLGVTRRAVLRLARGQGISIIYRSPHVDEKFNEAFLTSSSRGVVSIISIDGKPVGQGRPGRWSIILSEAYQAYVEERSENIAE
jgi:branched-chain amino acid aminotransferase